jgi:hypothetical protein
VDLANFVDLLVVIDGPVSAVTFRGDIVLEAGPESGLLCARRQLVEQLRNG